MLCIFVSGESKNSNFFNTVKNLLKEYGSCAEISLSSYELPDNASFLLSELPFAKLYNSEISVIILLNTVKRKNMGVYADCIKNTVAVINENNIIGAEILKNLNCPVINYGISENNTLNLSSISDNRAFVSLQREITGINGKLIEPHDFPVTLKKPMSVYPLLAVCAILLISEIDSANGYIF